MGRWLDPAESARKAALLMAIFGGIAIAARDGAGRDALYQIADDAAAALAATVPTAP